MLAPIETDSAPESVRSRLDSIAREAWFELSALSTRVHELPEAQRPLLRSRLLDLQSVQLRLRRFADEIAPGEESESEKLELAIRGHLELLANLKVFAQRAGLVESPLKVRADRALAMTTATAPPDDFDAARDVLEPAGHSHTPPYPGVYYMAPPSPGQQNRPMRRVKFEPTEAEYDDREVPAYPHDSDRGERHTSRISPRDLAGIAMLGLAVIGGGMAFADRIYRGRADEQIAVESRGAESRSVTRARDGEKWQGQLSAEPESGEPKRLAHGAASVEGPYSGRTSAPIANSPLVGTLRSPERNNRKGLDAGELQQSVEIVSSGAEIQPQPRNLRLFPRAPAAAEPVQHSLPPPAPTTRTAAVTSTTATLAVKPTGSKPAPAADTELGLDDNALFVPVLSTHKDAQAAREAFAELQKEHVSLLGAKQSEIQTLSGANGTWHRLVVTPATSKIAATEMCSKLRAAGYGRCWVKPY